MWYKCPNCDVSIQDVENSGNVLDGDKVFKCDRCNSVFVVHFMPLEVSNEIYMIYGEWQKSWQRKQEQLIMDSIRKNGGFNTFWVSKHQRRCGAIDRLIRRGWVVSNMSDPGSRYPWTVAMVMI